MGAGVMQGMCSKHDFKLDRQQACTGDAVCDLGGTTHAVEVGDDADRRHRVPHRGRTRPTIRRSWGRREIDDRHRRHATSAPASRASSPAT